MRLYLIKTPKSYGVDRWNSYMYQTLISLEESSYKIHLYYDGFSIGSVDGEYVEECCVRLKEYEEPNLPQV